MNQSPVSITLVNFVSELNSRNIFEYSVVPLVVIKIILSSYGNS